MLLSAGVDQVELEIGRRAIRLSGAGKIPSVDIIGPKVLEIGESCMEIFQGFRIIGKSCSLDSQKGGR